MGLKARKWGLDVPLFFPGPPGPTGVEGIFFLASPLALAPLLRPRHPPASSPATLPPLALVAMSRCRCYLSLKRLIVTSSADGV
jgi:hypothetical protein